MDINKNKVNIIPKVFDNLIGKSNTYIPAMHKNIADTFECTTKNVSFKGKTITREDILSRLDKVDMPEEIKTEIKEKMETQEQINLANKFLSDSRLYGNEHLQKSLSCWFSKYDKQEGSQAKIDILDKYLSDESLQNSQSAQRLLSTALMFAKTPDSAEITGKIFSNPILYENRNIEKNFSSIMSWSNFPEAAQGKKEIIDTFLNNRKLQENEAVQNIIGNVIQKSNSKFSSLIAIKFLSSPELYKEESLQRNIPSLISAVNTEEKADIVLGILSNPDLYQNETVQKNIDGVLFHIKKTSDLNYAMVLLNGISKGDIDPELAINLIKNSEKIRYKQVRNLRDTIPTELFEKIASSSQDVVIASSLLPLHQKANINEIPISERRNVLRALVKNNADIFIVSKDLREAFPLLPKNRKEYCTLLPALVKSLGIEVKPLSETQISEFEQSLNNLSTTLSKISENEFHKLDINLTYPKDSFIADTLSIVENLPQQERQKVFDYFGFDMRENKKNPTGFSLYGYPINIENNDKLAQITNEETKQAIELLKPKVIEFSENNTIKSKNKDIEHILNNILKTLPELCTIINRPQHGAHEYDVFKHSLKVMQKITQNPQFKKLDESDKKILLLASLFHDITKAEGQPDPNHAKECSFDTFYISKKFNLTKEEQNKLYTLIDTHEWLKHINQKDLTITERIQRLQAVSFDLQNDNIFDLSKIFTEADLKAIKKDDGLFNVFGPVLKKYAPQIKKGIIELQKSKPILPTTELPKASEIEKNITTTNDDSSTNIKGVYKKDGLIIIKYNEIENWEELGLKKGNVSHGIQVTNPIDGSVIDTGTIKFIAHGLDEANQLINFNAFNLPNSDALLSVSYMERPESKYRLFRPQGILLDVDANNIYGGGESDAGSGYKKSISDFKLNYIFDGQKQNDRHYISTLIKENLGLNDDEYLHFVKSNANKSMDEIQPIEIREKLIKCFALINSNTRQGNREYNEMYVSNPNVQGVYAYSEEDYIGEINTFIEKQPEFLKDYARQNDLPFFIFGN